MKRTCLQRNIIEDQRKLNTEEKIKSGYHDNAIIFNNLIRLFLLKFDDINMIRKIYLIVLGLTGSFIVGATCPGEKDVPVNDHCPFIVESSYVGDMYGNLSGGIKTGVGFLGMANLKLGFDTGIAHWWKGGNFLLNGASTHGKSPTQNYTGDFQVVSNIDAGNLVYLYELWYKQTFNRLELTFGLQDMNQLFAVTDNGRYYLNSSFGIPPVISNNVNAPIFPLTGLGFSSVWNINNKLSWLLGFFDGSPTDFENNPYNIKWDWDKDDGLFLISEIHYSTSINSLEGIYKSGIYYHTGSSEEDMNGLESRIIDRNYGIFLIGDQTIWKGADDKKINLFAQFAGCPGLMNNHNVYVGGGCNYYNPIKCKNKNALGVAFATAGFHYGIHKHETVIESFFNYQLNKFISLQPDIQYIINPAGTEVKLNNALIGFLRLGIQL